jgi:branched-chain amino acid transport system ATP-binding protein
MIPALELEGFTVFRGATPVVHGVDLAVAGGEVVALVGRNGSGRTSLLEGIAGLHRQSGRLSCHGTLLAKATTRERLRCGVALCPEGRSLFAGLTVWENLLLGGYALPRSTALARAADLLNRVPLLAERKAQKAGSMSGGEQQVLAFCRALVSEPGVMLLDEPTAGLGDTYRNLIGDLVAESIRRGRAFILSDGDLDFLVGVAHRLIGLTGGRVAFELRDDEHPSAPLVLERLLAAERAPEAAERTHDA